ncbi:laminin-like protein epi-1 [Ditylenchus destructor]|uniref:Laminin-like protein epi-1 n=1 Tax=Ditylenchus destructor TaxID=166010 RepID=A0AAD4QVZ1_9BILA|nr:laminin-like protein epi-1 [Ditylenchus destructor]
MGQVIGLVKKMETGEISRLQTEVAKLSDENAIKNQELTGLQLRLDKSEKQTKDEQKRSQNLANQMEIETESLREQIRKKTAQAEKLSYEIAEVKRNLSDCQTELSDAVTDANDRVFLDHAQISHLQTEVTEVTKDNAKLKRDLSNSQKRLTASKKLVEKIVVMNNESVKAKREFSDRLEAADKRIADMIKEKEEMANDLKHWEHLRQLVGEATEYAEGILKKKSESKDKESLRQQNLPRLVPIVPPSAWVQ